MSQQRASEQDDGADRFERLTQPLAQRLHLAERTVRYQNHLWRDVDSQLPVLQIDDFSGIPFLVDISGVEEYQHRARLRAKAGDLYAASTPQTPGYEAYCRDVLGLAETEFWQTDLETQPMYLADACRSGAVWRRLVEVATEAQGLTIHPFMGIEAVWKLAAALGAAASVPVTVLAPPPPVTWIANDKALFDEVVERVLGREWLVETYSSAEVGQLARHLTALARTHRRVALKRLRCASAMGNEVFEAKSIVGKSATEVEALVSGFLTRTEWEGEEEVLAVAWEDATHSPSTQLWIPAHGKGDPRLDGIYEQILVGERRIFMGSRPSQLSAAVHEQLSAASLDVARAFQALGYVGRCSFDFLIVGDSDADCRIHFTECNGRWGGTSTPMALLDRLFPSGRPPYRARDFVHPDLIGATFEDLLAAVGDQAWSHRSQTGKFLFYNTGPITGYGKLDVIALGSNQEAADAALEEELPRIWGL